MDKKILIIIGEPFFIQEKRKEILSNLPTSRSDVLIPPDIENINREVLSNNLFEKFKLIRISGMICKKEVVECLERFLSIDSEDKIILIEDSDNDKYNVLKNKFEEFFSNEKVEISFLSNEMKPKEIAKFVQKQALIQNLTMDLDCSELIIDLCDGNLSIINEEIIKLKLLFGEKVDKKQVAYSVFPIISSKDAIQFYVSLMGGDGSKSVSIAKKIISDEGFDVLFGCIIKSLYISLLIDYSNGNENAVYDFLNKKRGKFDLKWTNNTEIVTPKSESTSKFLIKVSKKLYDRVGSRRFLSKLFTQSYENYLSYRETANDSVASADIEKLICAISRS